MGVRTYSPMSIPLKLVKGLLSIASNGLAVIALLLLLGAAQTGGQFWQGLKVMFSPPPPETKIDIRSLVLQQIRGASELTTAIFGMESVVPVSRDRTVAGYVIGKTTLLYIAYGEVRAGVDLSELKAQDIQIQGDRVYIQLPPPKILDSKIDVTRSQVYDYDRGFLGLGPDVAPELQTLAQREILQKIVAASCQQDVLAEASAKAELAVTQLLNTAGFEQIEINASNASDPRCAGASSNTQRELPRAIATP